MASKKNIGIEYQFEDSVNTLKNLHSNSEKVTKATVNDFKNRGHGPIGKAVVEEYGVTAARIKKDFKGAKGGTATDVKLQYSGKLLTVGRFKMKPKRRKPKNKPYDVSIEVVKGQPKKLPFDTFVAPINETPQAFRREGKKRYPIEMVKTIAIPQMISGKRASPKVQAAIEEFVQSRKDHHEKRYFK